MLESQTTFRIRGTQSLWFVWSDKRNVRAIWNCLLSGMKFVCTSKIPDFFTVFFESPAQCCKHPILFSLHYLSYSWFSILFENNKNIWPVKLEKCFIDPRAFGCCCTRDPGSNCDIWGVSTFFCAEVTIYFSLYNLIEHSFSIKSIIVILSVILIIWSVDWWIDWNNVYSHSTCVSDSW